MTYKKEFLTMDDYYKELCISLNNINNLNDAKKVIEEKFITSIIPNGDFFVYTHQFGFITLFTLQDQNYFEIITNKFKSIGLMYSLISFNSFGILVWQDYEKEVNYLDCQTLFNLFRDISIFKDLILKRLSLKDIYYSKLTQKFFIKNFSKFILVNSLNISHNQLTYNPKYILYGDTPFKYINENLDYEKAELLPKITFNHNYQSIHNTFYNNQGGLYENN
ncbi:MAG: hypothetical protein ACRCZR_05865 [Cetobacterium sp.]